MITDQDDLEELHTLARRIGIKKIWFQDSHEHPHYDIQPHARTLAIRYGAIECTHRQFVEIIRQKRNGGRKT
jgi:hypothetical protein